MISLILLGYYIPSCIKMRYKGGYWPTYVLGRTSSGEQVQMCSRNVLDPESLDWNLLDKDLRTNLDKHHYFCLSGTNKRNQNMLDANDTTAAHQAPVAPNPKPQPDIDYPRLGK